MKKKKKKIKGEGGFVPENGRKSRKMKSIVPDLSEKIMACMAPIHGECFVVC